MVASVATLAALAGLTAALANQPSEPSPQPPPPSEPSPAPAADPLPIPERGDTVKVVFKDGRELEGVLVRMTQSRVEVQLAGGVAELKMLTIDRVEVLQSPIEYYRARRLELRDDDITGRIALVRWLEGRRLYQQALFELDGIQQIDPGNDEASRLRNVILQLQILDERRLEKTKLSEEEVEEAVDRKPTDRPERPASNRPTRPKPGEFPTLTKHQINTIKVFEVDLQDPPKISIERETVERFLIEYADHPLVPTTAQGKAAFRRKPAVEILDVMFRAKARDFYTEVEVLDQPKSMELFKDRVHSKWLINRCASTRCHGGSDAGRLRLLNRGPNSDTTVYTNFLILERFEPGIGAPMINYEAPENSLLIQMALRREEALYPHPEVSHWRPLFRDTEVAGVRQAVEWIKSMYLPRPEYPIEYDLPEPTSNAPEPETGPPPADTPPQDGAPGLPEPGEPIPR